AASTPLSPDSSSGGHAKESGPFCVLSPGVAYVGACPIHHHRLQSKEFILDCEGPEPRLVPETIERRLGLCLALRIVVGECLATLKLNYPATSKPFDRISVAPLRLPLGVDAGAFFLAAAR